MRIDDRALRPALGVLACAATALLYKGALDNPFVFDDRTTVLLNPSLVEPVNVRAVLHSGFPRVVVNLSYAVDRAYWGFSSFGFHATNFVLHVIVVGLFYGWCTRALADGAGRGEALGQTGVSPGSWPAFFAAATFALHPLTGAAASYVSARSELLCAVGFLVSLICARRAIVASSVPAGVLSAAFAAFALGSSGAAAGLPVVILTYDAWVLRDPGWVRRMWRVYLPAMAGVAILVAWHVRPVLAAARVPPRGLVDNLLTEAVVICRYLGLLLVPVRQSLVHQVHWVTTPADPLGLLALAALAAGLVAAVRARHDAPLVAFGFAWCVVAIMPTALVPLRDAMAEPRSYVAAAGLLLAAASWFAPALSARRFVQAAAVGVLIVLATLTHARNAVWADPLRLWEESVQRSPGAWQAHLGYADSLQEIRQCGRAIPEYEATLRLAPDQDSARSGLTRCR